jgi:hypothetical protein
MNHDLEEMLRKNAPKPPPAPQDELSLLLKRIEKKKVPRRFHFQFELKKTQWMTAMAAGVVIALGVPMMRKDLQQQGAAGDEAIELVSFAAETFGDVLESDTYVPGVAGEFDPAH